MMMRGNFRSTLLVAALGACAESQQPEVNSTEQAVTISYYVSPTGSGNQCKSNSPCSIATAKAKVQTAAPTMSGDVNVFMKTGTYVLSAPLSFGPADSGQNGFSVIWQADTGAAPIISGERTITGWTLYDSSKNIWRATATSLNTRQLYVNGVRADRARSISEPLKYTKTSTGFAAFDNLALLSFARPTDLEVSSYSSWKHFRCPVGSLTAGSFQNVVYKSVNNTGFQSMGSWTPDGVGDVVRQSGDFDNDGNSDLLLKYTDGTGAHNYVYLSSGSGFTPAGDWLPGSGSTSYVGDFNGDGKSDLLFPYQDGATWRNVVALSNGTSFYWPVPSDWLSNYGQGAQYRIGDFNGDFKDDILFAYSDGVNWHNIVALSTGTSFVDAGDWAPGSGVGTNYSIGDWNGDHRKDLLFSYSDGTTWHNTVMLSSGAGFYYPTPSDWLPGIGQGRTYYVGDWDGDLRDDLLFAYSDATGWHNTVAGSSGTSFAISSVPDWLPQVGNGLSYLVGDFAGHDVKKDLLLAGSQTLITVSDPCWTNSQAPTGMSLNEVTWIENGYELLDQPGEWYYDKVTSYIYYKPRAGETMSSATITAPVLETLLTGSGTLDGAGNPIFVHDIQFKNLQFSYATWLAPSTVKGYVELQAGWQYTGSGQPLLRSPAAVTFSRAQRIRFERNKFRKLGSVALNFDTGSQDNTVIGNHFTDISHSAIQIGDITDFAETNLAKQTKGNTVKDNYINAVASEYKSGVGVFFGYSKAGTVSFNEILSLPYTGVSMGWGWGQNSYAYQNSITQNYVHDVVQTLRDGGTVYTLSAQPQTTITGNYLKGVPNDVGIYLDEGSHNITATNNVVDSPYTYWMTMWTSSITGNTVQNNWARTDVALCNSVIPTSSANCNNFGGNVVNMNTFTTGTWPSGAQSIINAAGIEAGYADIKNW